MNKIILGLVGPLASGKGTMKEYLVQKYGAKDCRFSSILRDVLARVDQPASRENLQKLSTALRQVFGEDLLAKAIARDAEKFDGEIIVIDGVRRKTDIVFLNELENFYLIAIDAEPKLRYERMLARNENEGDKEKTFEQFLADHEAEADKEIPAVMETAEHLIDNNGDRERFYQQIDQLISDLRKK